MVKARIVVLQTSRPGAVAAHLHYIVRDGVAQDGQPARAYDRLSDDADLQRFEKRGEKDRHQFRFIVSPEDGEDLGDLRAFTRDLLTQMEGDLGTPLEWVAVDHWDTDQPHSHVVLRGKDHDGQDLMQSLAITLRTDCAAERAPLPPTGWVRARSWRCRPVFIGK